MASRKPKAPEIIELTELVVIHGDSLEGTDEQIVSKLARIKEALHERGIDFVDQDEAMEIWIGPASKEAVLETLDSLGFKPDVYQV